MQYGMELLLLALFVSQVVYFSWEQDLGAWIRKYAISPVTDSSSVSELSAYQYLNEKQEVAIMH